MGNENEKIDFSISEVTPYFVGFFILSGVLKQIIYYDAFNISIVDYLEFTEILKSFTDDLIILLPAFIGTALLSFNLAERIRKRTGGKKKSKSPGKKKTGLLRYIKKFRWEIIFYFIIPIILLVLCSIAFEGTKIPIILGVLYGISILMWIVVSHRGDKLKKIKNTNMYEKILNIVVLIILFCVILSLYTGVEIIGVKIFKKYTDSIICLDDKKIISDKFNYFIGKTNNYLFFYKEKEKKTVIYPMRMVKKIVFKEP